MGALSLVTNMQRPNGPNSTLNCAMGMSSPLGLRPSQGSSRSHSPSLSVLQGLTQGLAQGLSAFPQNQGLGQGQDVLRSLSPLEQVLSGRGTGLSALGLSSRGPAVGSPPGQAAPQPQDLQDLRVGSPMGPPGPPGPPRDRRADSSLADGSLGGQGAEEVSLERVCDRGERERDRDRERDRRKQDDRLIKRVRGDESVVDGADHDEDDLRIARDFLNSANNNDLMTNNNNRNSGMEMDLLKADSGPHGLFQDEMDALASSPGLGRLDLLSEPSEGVVVKCEPLLSGRQHSHN